MKQQDDFYQILKNKVTAVQEEIEQHIGKNPGSPKNSTYEKICQKLSSFLQEIDKAEQASGTECRISPEQTEEMLKFYQEKYLPEDSENQEDAGMTQQM